METEKLIEQAKASNWDRLKRGYLEKKQVLLSSKETPVAAAEPTGLRRRQAAPSITMATSGKAEAFSQALRRFNDARLAGGASFAIARAFRETSKSFESDPRMEQLSDCWESLAVIAQESSVTDSDNVFLATPQTTSLAKPYKGNSQIWQEALIHGSKTFLERMFVRYMDSTIALYPREAMLGGRPTFVDRVRAYANIKMKRISASDLERLDMAPNQTPYWLIIFYLIRAGWINEALEYAQSMEAYLVRSEPCFLAYLKAWSSQSMLPASLAQLRADYSHRSVQPLSHDPYKLAVMKLMGRCELARKTIAEVIQTSEDYLWLQLYLLGEGYTMPDLQKTVLNYGAKHFDPKGTSPLRYFQILLLVGLFEDAVAYLYDTAYQLEAIHVAIAMVYHGLLRVSTKPGDNLWEVKTGDAINFASLIAQYAKSIAKTSDQLQGLHYLFALTLIQEPAYIEYCHEQVRQVVLESPDAAALLGDVRQDGSVLPGFLSKHARLLSLVNEEAFMSEITVKAAEKCDREGRLSDALQLFNLAGKYTRVSDLLLRRLRDLIVGPFQSESLLSTASMAQAIFSYYRAQDRIKSTLGRLLEGGDALLALVDLRRFVEEGNWNQAVTLLETSSVLSGLFPLDQPDALNRAADRLRCSSAPADLPEPVISCIPEALLFIMQALHGRFQLLREFAAMDHGRQTELDRVRRQARSVMLMVGLLRMRIPPELCAQITRLDITLN